MVAHCFDHITCQYKTHYVQYIHMLSLFREGVSSERGRSRHVSKWYRVDLADLSGYCSQRLNDECLASQTSTSERTDIQPKRVCPSVHVMAAQELRTVATRWRYTRVQLHLQLVTPESLTVNVQPKSTVHSYHLKSDRGCWEEAMALVSREVCLGEIGVGQFLNGTTLPSL